MKIIQCLFKSFAIFIFLNMALHAKTSQGDSEPSGDTKGIEEEESFTVAHSDTMNENPSEAVVKNPLASLLKGFGPDQQKRLAEAFQAMMDSAYGGKLEQEIKKRAALMDILPPSVRDVVKGGIKAYDDVSSQLNIEQWIDQHAESISQQLSDMKIDGLPDKAEMLAGLNKLRASIASDDFKETFLAGMMLGGVLTLLEWPRKRWGGLAECLKRDNN